ncbi:TPA: type IV secretion protein Dot [Legionella pneumophila]|nr:type IV secretion protein Dot [Legionella pneumophila]HBI2945032.1 type IV secretion protein Dot [Legionella pneumophila]
MPKRLINKNIDIYNYPNELEDNLGSISLGDLHGNAIKLIHFLFRHKIIKFKRGISNFHEAYQQFVTIYEQYDDIVQEYLEIRTLLQLIQIKITNAKQRILDIDKKISLIADNEQELSQSLLQLKKPVEANLQIAEINNADLEEKLSRLKARLPSCIERFNKFMEQIEIYDIKTLIRLLGDEVADRGSCDYLTLKILDFLYQNQIAINIVLSNHGYEFIHAYEKLVIGQPFKPKGDIGDIQIKSFWGIQLLLEQGAITQEELKGLVERVYKPTLKIIDYSLSEDGITLYSHAPIRFNSIRWAAAQLGVSYDDSTKEALAETIDQMNTQLQIYMKNNMLHLLFENNEINDLTNMKDEERKAWPLIYLIWNRWNESKEEENARPGRHNGYSIAYVHGHDPFQSQLVYVYNLDTLCGKDSRKHEEEQINKAFQFLTENRHTNVDKTASESLLRNVSRYKVLDSDEYTLKPKISKKLSGSLTDVLDYKISENLIKLSLLGKSKAVSGSLSVDQDISIANQVSLGK